MNPLIEAAQDGLTQGWLMGVMTIFFLSTFVGWAIWAWAPFNRKLMEAAAGMPLDDSLPSRGDA